MVLYGNLKILMMINENTTIREFLQVLGTECLREQLNPNIHLFALFADYKPIGSKDSEGRRFHTLDYEILEFPNWLITDCRFENEAQAIKDRNGVIIKIKRDLTDKLAGNHPSETSLDDWNFDYQIENNGTIEELIEKVKIVLTKINETTSK